MAVPSNHAMNDTTYPPPPPSNNNGTSKASLVQADGSGIQPQQANMSTSANAAIINTPSIMQDYSFVMRKENGSTYIYPNNIQPGWTELKVGVLMPFHQQGNNYTRELTLTGTSAIRMAAEEINAKQLIPGAYITLVERDSFPKQVQGQEGITQAVFAAVSLIQEGVIGVIGDISSSWTSLSALMTSTLRIPQCSFSAAATSLSDKTQYSYFFRTIPTKLLYADAAISFLVSQGWPTLGILYTNDDSGQQLSESLVMKSKAKGIHVKAYQKFYEDGPQSDIQGPINTLMNDGIKIVFVAAEGDAQVAALTVAANLGHINNSTVWLTTGTIAQSLASATRQFNDAIQKRKESEQQQEQQQQGTTLSSTAYNVTADTSNAILYAAATAKNLEPIDFEKTYAGGLFSFESTLDLKGYPPYESFLDRWSQLDPTIYPYAGRHVLTRNEGLAYSCMMVMAYGFNQTINNSTDPTTALKSLASGKLGQYLKPNTFNTSFVGPAGPVLFDQNGDVMTGNFRVHNIQQGNQVQIGSITAGDLTLTSAPMYHDGTSTPPQGMPTRVNLNPGYGSPTSIAIGAIAAFGALVALIIMAIVILYRKREVFKAASPLFCVLELLGFTLMYTAIICYTAKRSVSDCIMIPITVHIGFTLVLSNLIAKNYRIYRIFNNVFITKTVVTDFHLLKVSGSILFIVSSLLVAWLSTSKIITIEVPLSRTTYYVQCSYQGSASSVFTTILTVVAGIQLLFATFLAIKTRTVGKRYSKYSEYRQIGISVYNIFFSALIGFVIYSVPTTDYYTRHYLTATTVLWATTFSMIVLFFPKLLLFFKKGQQYDASANAGGRRPDVSGRLRPMADRLSNPRQIGGGGGPPGAEETFTKNRELISINRMLASPNPLGSTFMPGRKNSVVPHHLSNNDSILEAHEGRMPVQVVFRYFPLLGAWDMKHVFLFPRVGYFSFYSEKSNKGEVLGYYRASVVSNKEDAYIFKVHGRGMYDVLLQVGSQQELEQWCGWFNYQNGSANNWMFQQQQSVSTNTCVTTQASNTSTADGSTMVGGSNKNFKDFNLEQQSGSSQQNLFSLEEGEESGITLDSCMNAPIVSESIAPYRTSNHFHHRHIPSREDEEFEDIGLQELPPRRR